MSIVTDIPRRQVDFDFDPAQVPADWYLDDAFLSTFLDALWIDARWPVAYRRQLLFELWDECLDEGPDDLVLASTQARRTIEAFVRKRLPRGSADAFSDGELEQLNVRRESKEAFRPYD